MPKEEVLGREGLRRADLSWGEPEDRRVQRDLFPQNHILSAGRCHDVTTKSLRLRDHHSVVTRSSTRSMSLGLPLSSSLHRYDAI